MIGVLDGSGSGTRSIARGTVPHALFGREGYAVLMGWLAMPTLVAQAASPLLGSALIEHLGVNVTIAALIVAAAINIVLILPLLPLAGRRPVMAWSCTTNTSYPLHGVVSVKTNLFTTCDEFLAFGRSEGSAARAAVLRGLLIVAGRITRGAINFGHFKSQAPNWGAVGHALSRAKKALPYGP